jgi:hypothetical protein
VSKLRWAKFFWADWANDTALGLCSFAAQGLWMRMLCLMAQGDPYGCLTIKGRPPTMAELRKLCGGATDSSHRNSARDFARWFAELEHNEVFQWVDIEPVNASPAHHVRVISASRMHHDGIIAMKRSSASHQRWKMAEKGQSSRDLHVQKHENGRDLDMQTESFASTEAEAEAEADVGGLPLQPPEVRNPPKSPLEGGDSVIPFSDRKRSLPHDA